jgi:hypothetical protein
VASCIPTAADPGIRAQTDAATASSPARQSGFGDSDELSNRRGPTIGRQIRPLVDPLQDGKSEGVAIVSRAVRSCRAFDVKLPPATAVHMRQAPPGGWGYGLALARSTAASAMSLRSASLAITGLGLGRTECWSSPTGKERQLVACGFSGWLDWVVREADTVRRAVMG